MSGHMVSVIIPVYNGEKYLAEAIESVLAQTYRPIEVIILDDGSTDNSADIAKRYTSARYHFQYNLGLSAAQNQGVNIAQGSFISFLDSDDIWVPDKLTQQMNAFNANSNLDMVFGHVEQFLSPELKEKSQTFPGHAEEIMPGYSTGTMLIKRDVFLRVGLFDTQWRVGDFIDWYSKAIEQGLKGLMLPDVLMKRRIHTNNMGIREHKHQTDYLRILKASLDRRRKKKNV